MGWGRWRETARPLWAWQGLGDGERVRGGEGMGAPATQVTGLNDGDQWEIRLASNLATLQRMGGTSP